MVLELSFVTLTRDDLVAVSHMLADALTEESLSDPNNPILWSNWGTWNCGKTLIVDEVTSRITGQANAAVRQYSSLHTIEPQRSYRLLDNFHEKEGVTEAQRFDKEKEGVAQGISNYSGIFFVHNSPETAIEKGAAIDVELRTEKNIFWAEFRKSKVLKALDSPKIDSYRLSEKFKNALLENEEWARLVVVQIHKPELFKPDFIHQAQMVSAMDHAMRFGPEAAP